MMRASIYSMGAFFVGISWNIMDIFLNAGRSKAASTVNQPTISRIIT
jgi:hypothetical protein